ncbi:serine hydrolase domain-containing protein [Virgibacillus salexigens]|uniref:serine hydrolase domain-containing protein n=1 Tax=Virgibacillus TaxID=84406 RepID=UPI00136AE6CD|nr:serine hydrolase domain-containing protein [Virgibacillus massiliensis]MYL43799.1 serine hydrolase [Virgibacillus massiliensis]
MKNDWSKFESYIRRLMTENNVAGAAVAVSKNGKVIYKNGFGYRDLENRKLVTEDTIFGIASITKSFTALAIMKLESEGKLSIDDPVINYLPEFQLQTVDMSQIKVHHLLSHTVGLPPIERHQELNRFQQHITYLANIDSRPLGKPGEYLSYCNDLYLLLGAIIEKVTGRLFRKYMIEEIIVPLGMHRTTYSTEDINKFSNVTKQYSYDPGTTSFQINPWENLGNYETSGGLRSSVMDLMNYGNIYINTLSSQQKTFQKLNLPKMWNPTFQIGENEFYGYGLRTELDYFGHQIVKHGGSLPGVSSYFGFIPKEKIVVAVLTNVSGGPKIEIWKAALHTALGLQIEKKKEEWPEYNLSSNELQALEGTYATKKKSSRLDIRVEKDRILAETSGTSSFVRAVDNQTLVMLENGKVIRFFINDNGSAWAAFFNLRMLPRVEDGAV